MRITTTNLVDSTPHAVSRPRHARRRAVRSRTSSHGSGSSATGSRGGDVVEVGCGPEATFLRTICQLTGGHGIGVDPSCTAGTDEVVTLIADRFLSQARDASGSCARLPPHTGAHRKRRGVSPAPRCLGRPACRSPSADRGPRRGAHLPRGRVLGRLLRALLYFTEASLEAALRRAGLRAERLRSGFDGQYLLVDAKPGGAAAQHDARAIRSTFEAAHAPSAAWQPSGSLGRTTPSWPSPDRGRCCSGKRAARPSPCSTPPNVGDAVVGIVDGNPAKRGLYLPGTSRSILGPQDVAALEPRHVVVMNAIYVDEVARTLSEAGVAADVCAFESLLAA